MRALVDWLARQPGWARFLIGTFVGGPVLILIAETGRHFLGRDSLWDYLR